MSVYYFIVHKNETISFSISKDTKYHGRNLFTVCMIAMTSQPPLYCSQSTNMTIHDLKVRDPNVHVGHRGTKN